MNQSDNKQVPSVQEDVSSVVEPDSNTDVYAVARKLGEDVLYRTESGDWTRDRGQAYRTKRGLAVHFAHKTAGAYLDIASLSNKEVKTL